MLTLTFKVGKFKSQFHLKTFQVTCKLKNLSFINAYFIFYIYVKISKPFTMYL